MTNVIAALAHLDAAQEAFAPIAQELNHARAALKRSNSKINRKQFIAAEEAFEVALRECDEAHEALMEAHDADEASKLAAKKAEAAALQPLLI